MLPMSLRTFVPTTAAAAAWATWPVGDVLHDPGPLALFEQLVVPPPADSWGGDSCWMQPARVVVMEPVEEEDEVEEEEWDGMVAAVGGRS